MKVFISSTYKDLVEYRAAAIRAVEGTNYQASKMEVFGARPDEPLDACLKEVEESHLFIGIYALRYGFIPEGADISITEMEYVHAKKLADRSIVLSLMKKTSLGSKSGSRANLGKSKLEDFKRRIQKDHICDYFTTSDDLGIKVSNALSHYVANHHEPEFPSPQFTNRPNPQATPSPRFHSSSVAPKSLPSSNPPSPPTPAPGAH